MTDLLIPVCWGCVVGLHTECYDPQAQDSIDGDPELFTCCCSLRPAEVEAPVEKRLPGRPVLAPGDVTDPTSTGRKRAALMAPIFPGMVCEWAGLKYAGGGVEPIEGCDGNTIADVKKNADLPEGIDSRGDRHHGPDKNTLNNELRVNLHRICSFCHNRWHARNDPHYAGTRPDAGQPWLPATEWKEHDPVTKIGS
jgi:hypothetical protein